MLVLFNMSICFFCFLYIVLLSGNVVDSAIFAIHHWHAVFVRVFSLGCNPRPVHKRECARYPGPSKCFAAVQQRPWRGSVGGPL